LEVVEDDGDEGTGEEVDEVFVGTDVSASKETIGGAGDLGSGSLLGVENLAIVVGAELEGGADELNVSTLDGHEEVLASADLGELQLELLGGKVVGSLDGTSGLNGEAITVLNGNLGAGLVDEADVESPTIFTNVGLFALDVQTHQLSLSLVDTDAFVMSNVLPLSTTSTSLLRESENEVLSHNWLGGRRRWRECAVHNRFYGLDLQELALRGRGRENLKGRFNLDCSSIIVK